MDFSIRNRAAELMDDPNMEFDLIKEAYKDINRCNKLLGGESITAKAVDKLIQNHLQKSYMVLDVGCGDGSMLRKLSDSMQTKGIVHHMVGIDLRDDMIRIARKKSAAYPNMEFKKMDIMNTDSSFQCDIIVSTLTMHHIEEEKLDAFLNKFVNLAQIGVVINDLQRSKWAYHLFKVFSFFFLHTQVARIDGLISISKGFKRKDLSARSKKIPRATHTIQWRWAFRYVWVMQINPPQEI